MHVLEKKLKKKKWKDRCTSLLLNYCLTWLVSSWQIIPSRVILKTAQSVMIYLYFFQTISDNESGWRRIHGEKRLVQNIHVAKQWNRSAVLLLDYSLHLGSSTQSLCLFGSWASCLILKKHNCAIIIALNYRPSWWLSWLKHIPPNHVSVSV